MGKRRKCIGSGSISLQWLYDQGHIYLDFTEMYVFVQSGIGEHCCLSASNSIKTGRGVTASQPIFRITRTNLGGRKKGGRLPERLEGRHLDSNVVWIEAERGSKATKDSGFQKKKKKNNFNISAKWNSSGWRLIRILRHDKLRAAIIPGYSTYGAN